MAGPASHKPCVNRELAKQALIRAGFSHADTQPLK
jgi:hypothetical protein